MGAAMVPDLCRFVPADQRLKTGGLPRLVASGGFDLGPAAVEALLEAPPQILPGHAQGRPRRRCSIRTTRTSSLPLAP